VIKYNPIELQFNSHVNMPDLYEMEKDVEATPVDAIRKMIEYDSNDKEN